MSQGANILRTMDVFTMHTSENRSYNRIRNEEHEELKRPEIKAIDKRKRERKEKERRDNGRMYLENKIGDTESPVSFSVAIVV